MGAEASINKAADDTDCYADNINNPVVYIGTAVKVWLYELYKTTESTPPYKYWEQSKAASSGEWEGQSGKCNEMDKLVADVRCRWRLV